MHSFGRSASHLVSIGILSAGLCAAGDAHAWPKATFAAAPARTNFTRKMRAFVKGYDRAATIRALPEEAKQYRYVLVKGLFGNSYPFYMANNANALRRAGLSTEFAPIHTAGAVADNVAIVKDMIRNTKVPIVFATHSQGSVVTSAAISELFAEDPDLVRRNVRGLLSSEGAYGGSPVADLLASNKLGRALATGMTGILGGKPEAIFDLQTAVRHEATAKYPMPVHAVPTISVVGYKTGYASVVGPGIWAMKRWLGLKSDGLVAHRDAVIPGSDVARIRMDHAQGAWGSYSERLTMGSLHHLFSMPYAAPDAVVTRE